MPNWILHAINFAKTYDFVSVFHILVNFLSIENPSKVLPIRYSPLLRYRQATYLLSYAIHIILTSLSNGTDIWIRFTSLSPSPFSLPRPTLVPHLSFFFVCAGGADNSNYTATNSEPTARCTGVRGYPELAKKNMKLGWERQRREVGRHGCSVGCW